MHLINRPAWLVASLAVSVCVAQDEVPSASTFMRRGSSMSTVIGDYVYFEGGEIAQEGFTDFRASNPVNVTLSIDISKSWDPKDVEINEIRKPSGTTPMTKQSMFTDEDKGVFYTWGGHTSWFAPLPAPIIMKFTADGKGGGSWSEDESSSTLKTTERVESGAYASTPNGGLVVGGASGENVSERGKGNVAGFVAYDFKSGEWRSDSSAPYSDDGSLYGATATYVKDFGPNGVVLLLGGMMGYGSRANKYLDFRTLWFLDPVTRDWNSQVTTGDKPSGRHYHCAAGVAGPNGTYEIFVFGGSDVIVNVDSSDIYVLSLPGFHWTRVDGLKNEARAEHTCTVVGGRQMLSWGGNNGGSKGGRWGAQDSLPQGIGIFDMTALEWRDKYDAGAKAYEPHSSIKSWYDDGGLDQVDWSSDEVRDMFVKKEENKDDNKDGNKENSTGGNKDNENNNSDPANSEPDSGKEKSKTPVAAIAGGVVGGVVVIAAIIFGIWFWRRRQGQKSAIIPQDYEPKQPPGPAMYDPAGAGPVYGQQPHSQPQMYAVSELPGNENPVELGGGPVPAELGQQSRGYHRH